MKFEMIKREFWYGAARQPFSEDSEECIYRKANGNFVVRFLKEIISQFL